MIKIQWVEDYFELRRLRRDLRIADNVSMGYLDQIGELKKEVADKQATIDKQLGNLKSVRADLRKAREQIREQTGADLLVNALRELGVVPKPGKYDAFKEADRLQSLANQQSRALGQYQGAGLANQLGGLF